MKLLYNQHLHVGMDSTEGDVHCKEGDVSISLFIWGILASFHNIFISLTLVMLKSSLKYLSQ